MNCPVCSSSNVERDNYEWDDRHSDEAHDIVHYYYTCQDCDTEYTVTETTTKEVTIDKRVKPKTHAEIAEEITRINLKGGFIHPL